MSIPNGPGRLSRVLVLGGTSEIGLAIVSALGPGPDTESILAGRDLRRLEAALDAFARGYADSLHGAGVRVPAPLVGLATLMKLIPRPVWRTIKR
jgi:hypothetical protein